MSSPHNMSRSPFLAGFDTNSSHACPFYFVARENLVGGVPDATLAMIVPLIAYWIASSVYTVFDYSRWKWLDQYRINEPEEVKSRNLVSRSKVLLVVLSLQVMQIGIGVMFPGDVPSAYYGGEMDALEIMLVNFAQQWSVPNLLGVVSHKRDITYWLYWWIIPTCRLILGALVYDTWLYFVHRTLHLNKFLYKHIHSIHHELYAPYGYGTMYNHPVEGCSDMIAAFVAISVAGLTHRQQLLFFTFTMLLGVHQHSGYCFPHDPFRWLSKNDAEFHGIHHQRIGLKYNFSQSLFIHWDVMLGTRLERKDIENRRRKIR